MEKKLTSTLLLILLVFSVAVICFLVATREKHVPSPVERYDEKLRRENDSIWNLYLATRAHDSIYVIRHDSLQNRVHQYERLIINSNNEHKSNINYVINLSVDSLVDFVSDELLLRRNRRVGQTTSSYNQ